MKTKFLSISLVIATLAIVCISCGKDDDNSGPSSPLNGKTTAVFNTGVTYGSMTDQDGNTYKTVRIGAQTWMAENLRTTKYNDGTTIPNVSDNTTWQNLITGAYCNYNNTANNDTIATFGRLYNWHAVNTGKLAPVGWHVPTDAEWKTLAVYLDDGQVAGGKLKENGTSHWQIPNTGATNQSGYTALPGGSRQFNWGFKNIGIDGVWWSATENDASGAFAYYMYCAGGYVGRTISNKVEGESVRCVRD